MKKAPMRAKSSVPSRLLNLSTNYQRRSSSAHTLSEFSPSSPRTASITILTKTLTMANGIVAISVNQTKKSLDLLE